MEDETLKPAVIRGPRKRPSDDGASVATVDPNEYDMLEDEVLEEDLPSGGVPVIHGAKVVYIGAARNMSKTFPGRLFIEDLFEDEADEKRKTGEIKSAHTEGGFQGYVWDTHDTKGRPVKAGRIPVTAPAEIAGKRFCIVEHAEHLRLLSKLKDFKALVPRKYRARFDEYTWRVERSEGGLNRLIKRVTDETSS